MINTEFLHRLFPRADEIPLEHRPLVAIRQRRVLINGESQKLGRPLPDRNSLLIKASLSSSGPCDRKTRKKRVASIYATAARVLPAG